MLESRLAQRIQAKKAQLDELRPLPATVVCRLNEQLTIEWIYNSNAIEGSTLSLRKTQLILEQGITIDHAFNPIARINQKAVYDYSVNSSVSIAPPSTGNRWVNRRSTCNSCV